jgi:thioredoxin reductase
VTIIEVLKHSPVLKTTSHGYMLHHRLKKAGARLLFYTSVVRIEETSIVIATGNQVREMLPVDQVIIAVGLDANRKLLESLQNVKVRKFVVGDAVKPRRIMEATEEGAKAAWSL